MKKDTVYSFTVEDASGEKVSMERYTGKVLLIVNTASKCGFTPQYEGLQKLYKSLGSEGLVVLAFPCNQFGGQEPEGNEKIQTFCKLNYGVNFPVFAKIDVNGDKADPLFVFLKEKAPGIMGTKKIKWNFTKFLVGRDGRVRERFSPSTDPKKIKSKIQKLLLEEK